jgi:hypothetical protein
MGYDTTKCDQQAGMAISTKPQFSFPKCCLQLSAGWSFVKMRRTRQWNKSVVRPFGLPVTYLATSFPSCTPSRIRQRVFPPNYPLENKSYDSETHCQGRVSEAHRQSVGLQNGQPRIRRTGPTKQSGEINAAGDILPLSTTDIR